MDILVALGLRRPAAQSGSIDAGSDPERPADIGDPVETDDWRVTALKVLWGQDGYDRYDPDDRRTTRLGDADPAGIPRWLALRVAVANLRDAEAYLSATAFMLADADGFAIADVLTLTPPEFDAAGVYSPGEEREGWVAFLPPDDEAAERVSSVRFLPFRDDPEFRYFNPD
jgi:hypothetical protein